MGHTSDPRGGGRWSHMLPVQGSGKGRAKAFPWAGGSWGLPWEQRTEGWAGSLAGTALMAYPGKEVARGFGLRAPTRWV